MSWTEFREKIGWLLSEHYLMTLILCVLIAGPIRGLLLVGILYLIAK